MLVCPPIFPSHPLIFRERVQRYRARKKERELTATNARSSYGEEADSASGNQTSSGSADYDKRFYLPTPSASPKLENEALANSQLVETAVKIVTEFKKTYDTNMKTTAKESESKEQTDIPKKVESIPPPPPPKQLRLRWAASGNKI